MNNLNSSPNAAVPTVAQLTETRLKQWHQQGEALLTFENLRSWINAAGLVLFSPKPQIAAPAPSLVEAVLGASTPNPTVEQTAEARGMLARMVAEGLAVPLNLLGVQGVGGQDVPDFVASTAVFSYVFTLRGDKAWKQPPSATGAVKVSNLAVAIYETLSQSGPLSAFDLSVEVGKEVTEAAALRALRELWAQLRVLPVLRADGPTLWELTSARFTKQIKAGANAGQPSALSALISLYLGQVSAASEDEVESFLSPLAPRSRIRDVVHALLSSRQLETIAVEGRTMVYVAGALPAFVAAGGAEPAPEMVEVVAAPVEEAASVTTDGDEAAPSITKYVPKPRKVGTGYLAKAKPAGFAGRPVRPRREFEGGTRGEGRGRPRPAGDRERPRPAGDRERPAFKKRTGGEGGFDKPWREERPRRFAPRPEGERAEGRPPRERAGEPSRGGRGGFGTKSRTFGNRPSGSGEFRPKRRDFGEGRPGEPRERKFEGGGKREGGGFGPRKPFGDRPPREGRGGFTKDGGGFAKKSRGEFQGGRGGFAKEGGPRAPERGPYRGGEGAEAEGGKPAYRRFDAPKKPRFGGDRPERKQGFGAERSEGAPRREGAGKFGKPGGKGKPGGFAGKPGGKKPFSPKKRGESAGKTGGPFTKFYGNKKPFGKRPPARKFKPSGGESA